MNQRWCRHYDGILNKVCGHGILYESVKDTTTRPYRWPCFEPEAQTTCAQRDPYTLAEEQAWNRAMGEAWEQRMQAIQAGLCPECQQPMTPREVGACVYAIPCGHRLYQGRLVHRRKP